MGKFKLKKRRHGRRNNRKQFIIVTVCLLVFVFILGTAYSAFSTNLTLSASGSVVQLEYITIEDLKKLVVTDGDGLYEDEYEEGRYAYKGGDVDNYIDIDGEIWRIISIESDGTLKIIKNESIGDMAWDENGSNDWSIATLNTYLNSTYSTSALDYAVEHSWNAGAVNFADEEGEYLPLSVSISEEQETTWVGYVALATVSELIRADTDETNCGSVGYFWQNSSSSVCYTSNWMSQLVNAAYFVWLLTPLGDDGYVIYLSSSGNVEDVDMWLDSFSTSKLGVLPVLYLSSDIEFDSSTDGTSSNPYVIVS